MAARWRNVGWLVALILVIAGIAPVPARAQEDVDNARAVAQQWLLQTLGKPTLILTNYTYEGTSWPDSSLGCPLEGQTYTPGTIHGYRWTFTFDNMVRYEVHTGLNGTPAALCSSANIAPNVRLITYTGLEFTILAPEAWLVFRDKDRNEVVFAPEAQEVCSEPGMRVVVIGRVANGVTPDSLIDEYLLQANAQDTLTERVTAGAFGRSTVYQEACDDAQQQTRVSAFVQYGIGYRVEQWAPDDEFGSWDELFQQMLTQFEPVDTATATAAAPAPASGSGGDNGGGAADASAPLELTALPLAHLFVGDLFLGALNDLPGHSVTSIPAVDRRYLSFSPDGLFVSFIDADAAQLRAMNVAGGLSPRKLADDVDPAFPPAWSPDSREIAYTTDTGETAEDGAAILALVAVPAGGGQARELGTFPFGGDCPVASSDPADAAYFKEAGPLGQENALVWLPEDRFLFSMRCDGGLGLVNLADGQIIVLGEDLRGGVVAPDRTRFIARTDAGLAVLDFTAWQRANLKAGANARQIAWGPDGNTVYYSTETLADRGSLDDPAQQARAEEVFGMWPVSVMVYRVELVRLDLPTGQETTIYRGQGRGIGRIAPAPDGTGVLFSLVPSSALVLEAFLTGGDTLALRETWPDAALYWLPADGSGVRLLAYSGQPAFAPITVTGAP